MKHGVEKKWPLKTDTVTAIAATFIALLALMFSIWQGTVAHKHDRLSVRPHLDIAWIGDANKEWGIRIDNAGIGPAEITKFEVIVDGKHNIDWDVDGWQIVIEKLWPEISPEDPRPIFVVLRPGSALKAGRQLFLLKFGPSKSFSYCPMKRLLVRIEYQSIYGDRRTLESDASKHPYFQYCAERMTQSYKGHANGVRD